MAQKRRCTCDNTPLTATSDPLSAGVKLPYCHEMKFPPELIIFPQSPQEKDKSKKKKRRRQFVFMSRYTCVHAAARRGAPRAEMQTRFPCMRSLALPHPPHPPHVRTRRSRVSLLVPWAHAPPPARVSTTPSCPPLAAPTSLKTSQRTRYLPG